MQGVGFRIKGVEGAYQGSVNAFALSVTCQDSFKGAYNKDSARVPMMRLPIFIMGPCALRAYGSGVLSIWGCRFAWTVGIGICRL